jgi:hypothetical protein
VFTARYALSPYIKQIRSLFKGSNEKMEEEEEEEEEEGQVMPYKKHGK